MRIVGRRQFHDPDDIMRSRHSDELTEIGTIISAVKADDFRVELSTEKTKEGRVLYSSTALNQAFRSAFTGFGWKNVHVKPDASVQYYVSGYLPPLSKKGVAYEMDFVKNRLGVQVQLGRYFFMVPHVSTKLSALEKLKIIDAAVEILPMQEFAIEISKGMSDFERFLSDLESGAELSIDTPILVLGIAP